MSINVSARRLLVSIHDVMPGTLDNAERIFEQLGSADIGTVTLLVVPNTGWTGESLRRLRVLTERGAQLAGHGWRHKAKQIKGVRHRLHSLLVSRDVAEHLALSKSGAIELMAACYRWFEENDLPVPELYVPPAWAMGRVSREDLGQLPFQQFETLTGVYDTRTKDFTWTPMVGFEADTPMRAFFCRAWNRLNLMAAGTSKPIRVAIHPQDLELRLADDLRDFIRDGGAALAYGDVH